MDPTLSEIRIFAGTFAPLYWAYCNGALLSIAENTALFSLIGTTYGGDGQVTFALPDLRSRCAVGYGQGPGLSSWDLGETQGSESVTLISTELPAHTHTGTYSVSPFGNQGQGDESNPGGGYYNTAVNNDIYASTTNVNMAPSNFSVNLNISGGSQPHENRMPYLALSYIICTEGIYPARS